MPGVCETDLLIRQLAWWKCYQFRRWKVTAVVWSTRSVCPYRDVWKHFNVCWSLQILRCFSWEKEPMHSLNIVGLKITQRRKQMTIDKITQHNDPMVGLKKQPNVFYCAVITHVFPQILLMIDVIILFQVRFSFPTWSSCSPAVFPCFSWRSLWVSSPAREESHAGGRSARCLKVKHQFSSETFQYDSMC